jgi:hypothetical protein
MPFPRDLNLTRASSRQHLRFADRGSPHVGQRQRSTATMGKTEAGIPYPVALPQSSGNQCACRSHILRARIHLALLSAGFLAFFFAAVCSYLPHHKEFVSEPLTLLFGHPLTDARKEELFL